jgi:hypothetical protein
MKTSRIISKPIALWGLLAFIVIGFSSCQKSEVNPAGIPNNASERETTAAKALFKRLPEIQIYDDKTKKTFRLNSEGFSFTENPSSGFNFSEPQGATYTNNTSGGQLVVSAQGFGLNSNTGSSGGLIQIGNRSLNVKYTFCFSADDEFFGEGIFLGNEEDFDGVSGVIGVDGDFNNFLSGENTGGNDDNDDDGEDSNANPADLFGGIGVYFVYDKKAQGTYPILNWVDIFEGQSSTDDENDFKKKGFAYYIDFKNEKISFAKSGSLNVSGGSITFNGKYLTFGNFITNQDDDNNDEDEDDDNGIFDGSFIEENGIGSMGCN